MPLTQVQSQMIGGNNSTVPTATGLGNGALNSNTGANNTAVGFQAGFSNTTGVRNTFIGNQAGNLGNGDRNTAVGSFCANNMTTGSDNTCFGDGAGNVISSGSSNTFIGRSAGSTVTTGAKNSILGAYNGNQGGLDIRTLSNRIVLSDGDGAIAAVYSQSGGQNIEFKGNLAATGTPPPVIAGSGVSVDCVEIVGSASGAIGFFMRVYFSLYQTTGSARALRLTFTRTNFAALVGFRMLINGEFPSDSITQYIARVATTGGGGGTYSSSNYATGDLAAGSWTNPGGTADFYWQQAGTPIASSGAIQGLIEFISPLEGVPFTSVTISHA
jgi:hypothetical protein